MATALELKGEGWLRFMATDSTRETIAEISSESLEEREKILEKVRKAVKMLKTKFGVKRVILIGSLAHAAWYTPESDVDIVVEGLPDHLYWEAWKVLEDEIADRPVDLIDLESASASLKRSINRNGIEL
jgi:predicted nucleotidyltransferase